MSRLARIAALTLACAAGPILAQDALPPATPGSIEPDGTVVVPSFRLPPSAYTSEEARAQLPRTVTDPEAMMNRLLAEGRAPEGRAAIGRAMAPIHAKFREAFEVQAAFFRKHLKLAP